MIDGVPRSTEPARTELSDKAPSAPEKERFGGDNRRVVVIVFDDEPMFLAKVQLVCGCRYAEERQNCGNDKCSSHDDSLSRFDPRWT